jgi:ankyrin repeat protein
MKQIYLFFLLLSFSSIWPMEISCVRNVLHDDKSAHEYCNINSFTRMAIIWPRAVAKAEGIKNILAQCGPIVYEKKFELFNAGPRNLFLTAHPGWKDDVESSMREYVPEDLPMPYHFLALMFATNKSLAQVVKIKQQIRDFAGLAWWSIHIDDTHEESVNLAQLLFVDNPDNVYQVLTEKLNRWTKRCMLSERYASSSAHEVANKFAQIGGNLNRKDPDGFSLLGMAAYSQQDDLVEHLVAHGADITIVEGDSDTPLLKAAGMGHEKAVRKLMALGANINALNKHGQSPLMAAATHGKTHMVQLLLKAGATVDQKDQFGHTPLASVVGTCYEPENQLAITSILINAGASLFVTDNGSANILMNAARAHDNIPVFELLLSKTNQINATDAHGKTALFLAIEGINDAGHYFEKSVKQRYIAQAEQKIALLLKAGAHADTKTNDGYYPLIEACKFGYTHIAASLINAGADLFVKEMEYTPLMWAVRNGYPEIVAHIIEKNPHNAHAEYICQTLHEICIDGGDDDKLAQSVRLLIDSGIFVSATRHDIERIKNDINPHLENTRQVFNEL